MPKPNILWIMTDQHRFNALSCMGHPLAHTPNIDRLAREGTLFTSACTPSPICAPARGAMFSGRFPPGCGMVTNWVPFGGDEVLLPEHLAGAGYTTALVGKLHFVPHRKTYGFMHRVLNDAPYSTYADDHLYSDYIRWLQQTLFNGNPDRAWQVYDEDEEAIFNGNPTRFFLGSNVVPEEYHMTTWTAAETVAFIDRHDTARPFFLFSSFFGPHQPYDCPEPWHSFVDPAAVELPPQFGATMAGCPIFAALKSKQQATYMAEWTPDDYRRIVAIYLGNVAMLDHYIGTIFDALDRRGLWDNTLIVFSSDHGDHAASFGLLGKGDMYDTSVRVPLAIKPAAGMGLPAGPRQVERPVNTLDLYGTLCEAGGVEGWRDARTEAGSLMRLLRGAERGEGEAGGKGKEGGDAKTGGDAKECGEGVEGGAAPSDDIYSIFGADADSNQTMLRRGPLKLIRLARPGGQALYELHDLRREPTETVNLYDDPTYRADRNAMQDALDRWWADQKAKYPATLRRYNKRV